MIQTFLTLDEAAEKLKGRGYTYELVQAAVAIGSIPFHVQNMVIVIPFPEADPFFPPVLAEKLPEPERKPALKKATNKAKV